MTQLEMKRIVFFVAALLLLAACQESIEERAAREAREMTEAKCPMPIGNNMMLDSIVFDIPSHTQSQYFRVLGEIDNESLLRSMDTKSLLVSELKNNPSYLPLMERNVVFHYVYRSGSDTEKVLLDLTLTSDDYR
jgi:hypothetical protein